VVSNLAEPQYLFILSLGADVSLFSDEESFSSFVEQLMAEKVKDPGAKHLRMILIQYPTPRNEVDLERPEDYYMFRSSLEDSPPDGQDMLAVAIQSRGIEADYPCSLCAPASGDLWDVLPFKTCRFLPKCPSLGCGRCTFARLNNCCLPHCKDKRVVMGVQQDQTSECSSHTSQHW
jgi:hypothetical protein